MESRSQKLSILDAFKYGFYNVGKHIWIIILTNLELAILFLCIAGPVGFFLYHINTDFTVKLVSLLFNSTNNFVERLIPIDLFAEYPLLVIFSSLLLFFCYVAKTLGALKVMFEIHDYGKSSPKAVFKVFYLIYDYGIAFLLVSIIPVIGLICIKKGALITSFFLLIVTTIIGVKYLFAFCFIIDKNMRPIDALRLSWHVTRGHFWSLFLFFWISTILFGFIGKIPVVGNIFFLFRLWILDFAIIFMYRKLVPLENR